MEITPEQILTYVKDEAEALLKPPFRFEYVPPKTTRGKTHKLAMYFDDIQMPSAAEFYVDLFDQGLILGSYQGVRTTYFHLADHDAVVAALRARLKKVVDTYIKNALSLGSHRSRSASFAAMVNARDAGLGL